MIHATIARLPDLCNPRRPVGVVLTMRRAGLDTRRGTHHIIVMQKVA
jgi:hypothetical protein